LKYFLTLVGNYKLAWLEVKTNTKRHAAGHQTSRSAFQQYSRSALRPVGILVPSKHPALLTSDHKKFVSDALYANASAYRLRKYVSILHGIVAHKNEHFS